MSQSWKDKLANKEIQKFLREHDYSSKKINTKFLRRKRGHLKENPDHAPGKVLQIVQDGVVLLPGRMAKVLADPRFQKSFK